MLLEPSKLPEYSVDPLNGVVDVSLPGHIRGDYQANQLELEDDFQERPFLQ